MAGASSTAGCAAKLRLKETDDAASAAAAPAVRTVARELAARAAGIATAACWRPEQDALLARRPMSRLAGALLILEVSREVAEMMMMHCKTAVSMQRRCVWGMHDGESVRVDHFFLFIGREVRSQRQRKTSGHIAWPLSDGTMVT
jgi:hypothetical protein